MISVLLSNVWMVFLNPHKASTSFRFILITRSLSCLWNTGWSFWSRTMITSPGSSPGSWSPSPWNVIFWPSFIPEEHNSILDFIVLFLFQKTCLFGVRWGGIPLSIWTSRIFFCRSTLCPLQFLQRSLELNFSPWPWQSGHMLWICWIMPGPICCTLTWTPLPLQFAHFSRAPFLPP